MSEHRARISWEKSSESFDYEEYNREHEWSFPGGISVQASAAPDFKGKADRVDPEEALVASISSCHMLTFLAIASKKRLTVESYVDEAVGYLEKNENGKLAMTRAVLKPKVQFAEDVSAEDLKTMHDKAHHNCFIANSVLTEVSIEL